MYKIQLYWRRKLNISFRAFEWGNLLFLSFLLYKDFRDMLWIIWITTFADIQVQYNIHLCIVHRVKVLACITFNLLFMLEPAKKNKGEWASSVHTRRTVKYLQIDSNIYGCLKFHLNAGLCKVWELFWFFLVWKFWIFLE